MDTAQVGHEACLFWCLFWITFPPHELRSDALTSERTSSVSQPTCAFILANIRLVLQNDAQRESLTELFVTYLLLRCTADGADERKVFWVLSGPKKLDLQFLY